MSTIIRPEPGSTLTMLNLTRNCSRFNPTAFVGLCYTPLTSSSIVNTKKEAMASAKNMGIKVEKSPPQSRINEIGALKWPKWPETIAVSKFPWTFESKEKCYLLEGKVRVYPEGPHGEDEYVEVSGGDLVEFPKGLKCTWDVIQPINKHYINE